MKQVWAVLAVLLCTPLVFAQEQEKQTPVLQYTGFSFGATGLSQFAVGDYADFALCNVGGGAVFEYALPLATWQSWGFSVHGEYGHVIPKSDSIFKSDDEIRATAGIWWRVPFAIGNAWYAFQPELTAGVVIWNSKYDSDNVTVSDKKNVNVLVGFTPAFRKLVTPSFDLEVAPLFTVAPEKEAKTMMVGARLGAIFHVQDAIVHHEDIKAAKAAKPPKEPKQPKVKAEKAPKEKSAKAPVEKSAKPAKGDLIQARETKLSEASAARTVVSEKRAEENSLASQIAANDEQIAALNSQIENTEDAKTVASLKKEVASLEKANATLEKQRSSAVSAAEKAEANANACDNDAADLLRQIGERAALQSAQAQELRTSAAQSRAEAAALREAVTERNNAIREKNAKIDELTARNEALASEIESLKAELSGLDKKSDEGIARKAEIDEKTSLNKAEIAENKKTIASIQKEIGALKKENAGAEKPIAALDESAEKTDALASETEAEARRHQNVYDAATRRREAAENRVSEKPAAETSAVEEKSMQEADGASAESPVAE